MGFVGGSSLDVWSLVFTGIGLVIGFTGALYARRSVYPRRQLTFGFLPAAPLLSDASRTVQKLKVSLNNEEIEAPYILVMEVRNSGKLDISSELFDASNPIVVDPGVPIIEVLASSGAEVIHSGTQLIYPPQLIKAGTERTVQMLLDGEPTLSQSRDFVTSPLVDVKVNVGTPESTRGQSLRRAKRKRLTAKQKGLLAGGVALLLVCFAVVGVLVNTRAASIGFSRSATSSSTSAPTDALLLKAGDRVYFSGRKFKSSSDISFWICSGSTTDSFCFLRLYASRTSPDGTVSGFFDIPRTSPIGNYFIRVEGGTNSLTGTLYQDVEILPP